MTNILKILLLSILAYGCNANDNPVEDELYNCLVQEYKSKGVDIATFLDSMENHYIRKGILKDNSGKSKFDFYKQIANSGEVPIMDQYDIADSVAKIDFFQKEIESCLNGKDFDSITLTNSPYSRLMEDFKTVKEINPKNAAICHVNVLSASDFEHPYFRAHMLITYARIYEQPRAFIRK